MRVTGGCVRAIAVDFWKPADLSNDRGGRRGYRNATLFARSAKGMCKVRAPTLVLAIGLSLRSKFS